MVEHPAKPAVSDVFAALGHPVRCAIVERLRADESRVTDLARAFPISLAAVSKHVAVLEDAGLVRRRIDGRTHWLSMDPRPLSDARHWLDDEAAFWSGRLDALAAGLHAERTETLTARTRRSERSA
jgi:DNA-binding transcriptional ArsR family regulator